MRHRARTATLLVVASVAASCSPNGLPESPSEVATETAVAGAVVTTAEDAALPLAVSTPPTASLPATVTVVQPDLVIDAGDDLDSETVALIETLPGLEHAAAVARIDLVLTGPEDSVDAEVLVVDPAAFRPLTPEVTAQAVGVWERLAAGDVVIRHDVGALLGIEPGDEVLLAGEGGSRLVRVGALAANGSPPVAAALVPWSLAATLGVDRPTGYVLAVSDEEVASVESTLAGVLGEESVQRREAPTQRTASAAGSTSLEAFSYTDLGDGSIVIDPAWVDRWIAPVTLPGIATTKCHRLMIPQLLAALEEIQARGLYDHFKPEQFGGCWVPRHIDWNPDMPLSNHAWGLAVDLNTHDNWLGDPPQMDLRIVEIFERWGFEWGGHWRRPDGMHFELARIVEVG